MREFQRFLPEGWTAQPSTPLEALKAAKDVLRDEQKWIKGHWFTNQSPDTDPNDGYCNHWQVCAAGAVGIVTIGLNRLTAPAQGRPDIRLPSEKVWQFDGEYFQEDQDKDLYDESLRFLIEAINEDQEGDREPACGDDECEACPAGEFDEVPEFNDETGTTHRHVMAAFDLAIAKAESIEQVDHILAKGI